ncbi:MAG: T9SS type A sorting domain-containing protein [Saprospiraceae bacterium]|nr:T9SS type A sorting domain-containing protein [Saprospiraceae bacterium]
MSYVWSTGQTTPTINITATTDTTFSVIVTDAVGCMDTATIRINADTQAPTITCPAPITVSCANLVPAPNTALVMATDPQGGPANVTFVKDSITNQTCANRFLIHRIYQAADTCNNVSRCIQLITVNDQTAPVISTIPANVTVSCANLVPAANTGAVVATDGCGGTVTITVQSDVITNQTCANRYTITRTYVATDLCGNSSTQSQIITVNDQTPPVISSIPVNVTVSCANLVPASNTGAVMATDGCGGTVNITVQSDVITNQTCANRYTITRTYVATDLCGNSSTQSQIITVNDQTPPVISSIPANVTVSCANNVPPTGEAGVMATDGCGGTVTITVQPDVITNQTCANRYTITRTYVATDLCGNSSTLSQIITVNDQTPPVITPLANVTVSCTENVPPANTASINATDGCGGLVNVTVMADVVSNQTCANRYTITRTYVATDVCGNSATFNHIITVNDQQAPTPPMAPLGVSYPCLSDTVAGMPLVATDNCSPTGVNGIYSVSLDTLNEMGPNPGSPANPIYVVRKWTFTDACGNMSMATSVDTINNTTMPQVPNPPADTLVMCITDTVPSPTLILSNGCGLTSVGQLVVQFIENGCSDTIIRTWTFDRSAVSLPDTSVSQTIVVKDTIKPVLPIVALPDTQLIYGCAVNFVIQNQQIDLPVANDNCSGTIAGVKSRTLVPRPGCLVDKNNPLSLMTGNMPFEVLDKWVFTDACGNKDSLQTRYFFYDTIPPQIIPRPDLNFTCKSEIPAQTTLNAASEIIENCTPGSPILQNTVVTLPPMGIGSKASPYMIQRVYTVRDNCFTVRDTQKITVIDSIPPVASSQPAPVNVSCAQDTMQAPVVTATDNCGPLRSSTYVVTSNGGAGCPMDTLRFTRTWTFTDSAFNMTTVVQIVNVVDNVPPMFTSSIPGDTTINCLPLPPPTIVPGTDNCSGMPIIPTFSDSLVVNTQCTDALGQRWVRTYKLTDACMNTSVMMQNIYVKDTVEPVINEAIPVDVFLDCVLDTSEYPAAVLTANDNCSGLINAIFTTNTVGSGCPGDSLIITRTWTFGDACNNGITVTQKIKVLDNVNPTFTSPAPEDQFLTCVADTSEYPASVMTAEDNCQVNPIQYSTTTSGSGCIGDTLVIRRIWRVSDQCGNAIADTQFIRVVDNIAPVIQNLNGVDTSDVVVGCQVPPPSNLTAFDNCNGNITVSPVDTQLPGGNGSVENPFIVNRVWTFTDSCGNTLVVSKQISIADNIAPAAPADFPDTLVMCFDEIPAQQNLSASDECGGNNTVSPIDETTKIRDCEYLVIRRWIFSDAVGNRDTTTWRITVRDTISPVFSGAAPDTLVMCLADVPAPLNLTASDNCSSTPIAATVQQSISENTGCIGDTITVTRTYTFTDSCMNSTRVVQIISVVDTVTPYFTVTSPDTLVTCFDQVPPAESVEAFGACGQIPAENIMLTETVDSVGRLGCVNDTIFVRRTYVATNACGTSATFVQTIFVVDTVPPMSLTCNDITINVDDSGNATTTPPIEDIVSSYTDCNLVTASSNLDDFNCSALNQGNTFQILLVDACGNETICEPNATVLDGLAPTFVECPMDMVIQLPLGQCDTLIDFVISATDNCGDPIIDSLHNPRFGRGLPFTIGVHELFYIARDISGNMDTCSFVVTVLAPNGKADLSCLEQLNYSVTEECEIYLSADMFLTGNGYACADLYIVCVYLDEAKTIQIPNDTILDRTFLGKKLIYEIKDTANNNSCWGYLLLEDKIAPMLIGGKDTLMCGDVTDPEVIGFPTDENLVIVKKVSDSHYIVDSLDNCTLVDLYLKDSIVSYVCQGPFSHVIYRKWTAIDGFGRTGEAVDTICFTRPTVNDVIPPANYDGIENPSLSCDGDWARLANGAPDTTVTGVPGGTGCFNIRYVFDDQIINLCEDGSCKKIIRKWTVFDWCTGEFRYFEQLIKIEDKEAPVIAINAGKDTTAEISGTECFGWYKLPVPTITDNCSDIHNIYNVWSSSGRMVKEGKDYILYDLIEGYHTIYYSATDCCGNIALDSLIIRVIDNNAPVAIVREYTTLSLTNDKDLIKDGFAKLYPFHIDNGSYDNCNAIHMEIRRDDQSPACKNLGVNGYNNNLTYNNDGHVLDNAADTDSGKFVTFCCEDVGKEVKVWLRVWDDANHSGVFGDVVNGVADKYNETWGIVKVEDKTAPILVPPTDMTVSCYYEYVKEDLGKYFGRVYTDRTTREEVIGLEPICSDDEAFDEDNPFERFETVVGYSGYAVDACDVKVVETYKIDKLCDEYLITRTFVATDLQGLSSRAVQRIKIIPCVEFFITDTDCDDDNPNDGVIWPCDYEVTSCDAQTDTTITGRPIIDPRFCESIGINYSDWIWGDKKEGCYKIERVWRLMKYCSAETWEYHQWIDVKNGEKPTILNCTDLEMCADDATCIGQVSYTLNAEDDCTAEAYLYYSYAIDLGSDGIIDFESTGKTYNRSFPRGEHLVIWTVRDICGNVAECHQKVTVKDCKKPVAYCYQELSTSIGKNGEDRWLWSSDFDRGSYDNCGEPVELSFSENVLDDSLLINCDLMITYPETKIRVDLYVTDKSGNVETCPIILTLIDPTNYCIDNQGKATVSGDIRTSTNFPINKYDISISSQVMSKDYTSSDMKYKFDKLPMYDDYLVAPTKKDEVRAGVNTLDLLHIQRHVLRLKDLNDPLKLIAADANNDQKISVNDLVDIRKVILEVYNTFPRTNAWRFVRRGINFVDSKNPWPFEEVIQLENLSKNEIVNYTAIKVGDVNDSYTSLGNSTQQRSEPIRLLQKSRVDGQGNKVIDLYPESDVKLSGYQFSLTFTGESGKPALVENAIVNRDAVNIVDDEVLVSWFDQQGHIFGERNPMLTLNTGKNEVGGLQFTNRLSAEAYDESLSERALEIINGAVQKRSFVSQVNPNPFVDQTSFRMELVRKSSVNLKIFDATGQLILSRTSDYDAGDHEVTINGQSLPVGAYSYRVVINDNEVFTHRFIKIR